MLLGSLFLLRQHGKSDNAVIIKLLMTLYTLSKLVVIKDQDEVIISVSNRMVNAEKDQHETEQKYQDIIRDLPDI